MAELIQITAKDIKNFQNLYKKYFDQIISPNDAADKLTLLIRQMELVYSPIKRDEELKNEDENCDATSDIRK